MPIELLTSTAKSSTPSSRNGANIPAARKFFGEALTAHGEPNEVITDLAQALETAIEIENPDAFHNTEQYANNRVECHALPGEQLNHLHRRHITSHEQSNLGPVLAQQRPTFTVATRPTVGHRLDNRTDKLVAQPGDVITSLEAQALRDIPHRPPSSPSCDRCGPYAQPPATRNPTATTSKFSRTLNTGTSRNAIHALSTTLEEKHYD